VNGPLGEKTSALLQNSHLPKRIWVLKNNERKERKEEEEKKKKKKKRRKKKRKRKKEKKKKKKKKKKRCQRRDILEELEGIGGGNVEDVGTKAGGLEEIKSPLFLQVGVVGQGGLQKLKEIERAGDNSLGAVEKQLAGLQVEGLGNKVVIVRSGVLGNPGEESRVPRAGSGARQ